MSLTSQEIEILTKAFNAMKETRAQVKASLDKKGTTWGQDEFLAALNERVQQLVLPLDNSEIHILEKILAPDNQENFFDYWDSLMPTMPGKEQQELTDVYSLLTMFLSQPALLRLINQLITHIKETANYLVTEAKEKVSILYRAEEILVQPKTSKIVTIISRNESCAIFVEDNIEKLKKNLDPTGTTILNSLVKALKALTQIHNSIKAMSFMGIFHDKKHDDGEATKTMSNSGPAAPAA